jgi:hypothetical protein
MGGWGMTFMIVGNLLFRGLLIFVAVLMARYVARGQDCFRPTRTVDDQAVTRHAGETQRFRLDHALESICALEIDETEEFFESG